MQCLIHRRAEFSASHRYWLPELSDAENQARFGVCTRFPGHGHNYVLFVALLDKLDEYGMVRNLSDVKRAIRQYVLQDLNFSYLNTAWPEFEQTLPTTEFIAKAIWQRLAPHLPLVNIQLFEHPRLWADYAGNAMQAALTIRTHFSAAHLLALDHLSDAENTEIYGKCARPNGHGHNYHLEVTIVGEIEPRTGMIVDLPDFQNLVNELVIEPFDHTFLNKDIAYFAKVVPTAENIALHIAQLLQQPLAELGVELDKVKLIESPNNSAEIHCRQPATLMLAQSQAEPLLATR
ncbi:MAG: 6-pyruvoyl tetrahydropterin synthase [Spirulinaceae cyanobacterium SM2_1_0]|nr:6-pyruvoyl tetrahydropterin synthase [Spirulinaceae cyanobacterium SM2_1_0]